MVRQGLDAGMRTILTGGGWGRVLPVFYMARTYRELSGRPSPASPELATTFPTPEAAYELRESVDHYARQILVTKIFGDAHEAKW